VVAAAVLVSFASAGSPDALAGGVDWPKYGFDLANTGFNPTETTISPANVAALGRDWGIGGQHFSVFASPVVANGRLYLPCQPRFTNPATPQECAVDTRDGHLIWQTILGSVTSASTAAVSGGRVYVADGRPARMYALDAATGQILWRALPTSATDASYGGAPVVSGGMVYMVFNDGYLRAYRATTGAEVWNVFLDSSGMTTPAIANGILYVEGRKPMSTGPPHGVLDALDARSGRLLWWSTDHTATSTLPVVANGLVYIATGYETNPYYPAPNLLAYPAGGCAAPPCPPAWQVEEGGVGSSASAYANGVLYQGFKDGTLHAFSGQNGDLLWTGTTALRWGAPWPLQGAPAVANGVVYQGGADGRIHAWSASGCGQPTCAPLWTASIDEADFWNTGAARAQPAILDGTVYISSSDPYMDLYAFRLGGGRRHSGGDWWRRLQPRAGPSSAVRTGGWLR